MLKASALDIKNVILSACIKYFVAHKIFFVDINSTSSAIYRKNRKKIIAIIF